MTLQELLALHCQPRTGKEHALPDALVEILLSVMPGWEHRSGEIRKEFRFTDYFHTMAFVNAVASIAHREDHHPDLEVHYNRCLVRYSTHDVGGLSMNDFVCAAKVEELRART